MVDQMVLYLHRGVGQFVFRSKCGSPTKRVVSRCRVPLKSPSNFGNSKNGWRSKFGNLKIGQISSELFNDGRNTNLRVSQKQT